MKRVLNKTLNLIVILPLVTLFIYSIFINYQYDDVLPSLISFRNYKIVFNEENIKVLLYSIILSLASSFLSVIASYLFVRVLRIYKCSIANILKLLSAIPILVPAFSYIMGIGVALNLIGINDTIFGVIISHAIVILPYSIFLLDNSFEIIGEEYEELAFILGANEIKTVFDISLPMLRQSIFNSLAIGFVISFSQYFITLIIGGGVVKTYAMIIFPLIQGNNRGLASASALIYCLINIIIYMFFIKKDNNIIQQL